MAYASLEECEDILGVELETDFEKHLELASDMIDRVTFNRIRGIGFRDLSHYQQEMVKKAVCYQAAFVENYGEYLNVPFSSFSAGSISMSFKGSSMLNGQAMDSLAIDLIRNTGLATRLL